MRSKSQILSKLRADGHITDNEYKMLVQEPCDDSISRQAVLDLTGKSDWFESSDDYNDFACAVCNLPPVTPQQKTGHWIKISPAGIYECSECGKNVMTSDIFAYKFCHVCGIKMQEIEE